jgi:hypothetical protein
MDPKNCYNDCVRQYPNNYSGQSAHATCYDYCNQVNRSSNIPIRDSDKELDATAKRLKSGENYSVTGQNIEPMCGKEHFVSNPDGMYALKQSDKWGKCNTEGWNEAKCGWGNDELTNYFKTHQQMRKFNQDKGNVYDQYYARDDYDWNDATVSPYVMEIMSHNMHIPAMPNARRMYPGGGDKVSGESVGSCYMENAKPGCVDGSNPPSLTNPSLTLEQFSNGGADGSGSATFSPYVQQIYNKYENKEKIMNSQPFTLEKSECGVQGIDESTNLKVINSNAGKVFNNRLIMSNDDNGDITTCHKWCDDTYEKGMIKNMSCHKDCNSINPNIPYEQLNKHTTMAKYDSSMDGIPSAEEMVKQLKSSEMEEEMKEGFGKMDNTLLFYIIVIGCLILLYLLYTNQIQLN